MTRSFLCNNNYQENFNNMANVYTKEISKEQAAKLKEYLEKNEHLYELGELNYGLFKAKGDGVVINAYNSGKLVVQGKNMGDFIQFILEPEILHEVSYGYETELMLESFQPHAGVDESGKGDFFGPLVIAAVYVNRDNAKKLMELGVADSKSIKSAKKIFELAKAIKEECGSNCSVITIGNDAYNRMYNSFKNLNKLLAWGHAKSIESMLEKTPECGLVISDQFARNKNVIKNALMEKGQQIELQQMHKAESDIAVAAASILARATFVFQLNKLSEKLGCELPLGCGKKVKETAFKIAQENGIEFLDQGIKQHFKTRSEIIKQL